MGSARTRGAGRHSIASAASSAGAARRGSHPHRRQRKSLRSRAPRPSRPSRMPSGGEPLRVPRHGRHESTRLPRTLGVPRSHVALGCGSSEILEAAVSAFTSPDAGLLTASPTFELPADRAREDGRTRRRGTGGRARAARSRGDARSRRRQRPRVRLQSEQPDVDRSCGRRRAGVHRRRPCAIARGRPCSSTRRITTTSTCRRMRRAIPLATADPRVMVARTFSKIHGMAGMRVGYAVGQPATLRAPAPMARRHDDERARVGSGARLAGRRRAHRPPARPQPRGQGVHARRAGAGRLHRVSRPTRTSSWWTSAATADSSPPPVRRGRCAWRGRFLRSITTPASRSARWTRCGGRLTVFAEVLAVRRRM